MIIVQFLVELIAFFLLFTIFRVAVVKAFPVKAIGMPLSMDSKKALRKFRNRYITLFLLLGSICSAIFWYLLVLAISKYHAAGYSIVLVVEHFAVVLPAVILGFLAGTFLARSVNHYLQRDGLSFFFEGFTDELKGFDRLRLQFWQIAMGVLLALALIIGQFHHYIKVNDEEIVIRKGLFENQERYTISEASLVELKKKPQILGLVLGSDTLLLSSFSGDKEGLARKIKAGNSN